MSTEPIELSAFFEQPELTPAAYNQYADAAHASFAARERFETLAREQRARAERGEGGALRAGLAHLALGRFSEALELFGRVPAGDPLRHYYAGEAALALNRFQEAIQEFKRAASAGWDVLDAELRMAAVHIRAGDRADAEKLLSKHAQAGQRRAEWHFVRGLLTEMQDDRVGAVGAYEQAAAIRPDHSDAMFNCARLYDLLGDEELALAMYDRLAHQPRAHVNALLNAAVVYEDRGDYNAAADCLRRVLKAYPNHKRARLFLKSVESCKQMVIEEHGEAPVDARVRLLATPLTEFELSVRARNCLKKMNVRTLGDLIKLSEAELLAYKNFGETSLNEIKALLSKRNLRLGLKPEEVDFQAAEQVVAQKPTLPPGQEALLSKPVSELELSVRSRRCLQRLGVHTLGELIQLTEPDLLATRNFGVTSLNEIKTRLADHGLQLATKHAP